MKYWERDKKENGKTIIWRENGWFFPKVAARQQSFKKEQQV